MFFLSSLAWLYFGYALLRVYSLMHKRKKIVISVDGNIGSGKSTLLGMLGSACGYTVITEPTEEWKETGILDKYYHDQKRNAFEFQSFVLTTHDKYIQDALKASDIVITERCPETHRSVFFEVLNDNGYFDAVQQKLYDCLFRCCATRVDAMIYIDSDVELSYARVLSRGRVEEKYVKKSYLQTVHDKHQAWVEGFDRPVLTISGKAFKANTAKVMAEIREFVDFVQSAQAHGSMN